MIFSECGAEACNGLSHSKLPKAHHIHVSLNQEAPSSLSDGGFVLEEAVKDLSLVVYGRLWGVYVLGLLFLAGKPYGPCAKGHNISPVILYWKDYSAPEPVVPARGIRTLYDKARLFGKFQAEALFL